MYATWGKKKKSGINDNDAGVVQKTIKKCLVKRDFKLIAYVHETDRISRHLVAREKRLKGINVQLGRPTSANFHHTRSFFKASPNNNAELSLHCEIGKIR